MSKLKESEQPSFLHLHHRKTKTVNHFEFFLADFTAFCPQKIGIYYEICGRNNFFFSAKTNSHLPTTRNFFFFCEDKQSLTDNTQLFFFCEDKQSLTDNTQLDFLMISNSARFLSSYATLAVARLLQVLFLF